jgi:hypothetical protein
VCLFSVVFGPSVRGQSNASSSAPPTLTSKAGDVNQAGYSLKPIGLALDEWPSLRLDFSIERGDYSNFKNLSSSDVQAKIDERSIEIRDGDLKLNDTRGSAVMILLDGSGSMVGVGVDKLRAAKEGLKLFVDSIGPKDRVGLMVFDEEVRLVIPPTTDKEALKRDIDAFQIRKDRSRFTRLYQAVESGIREAKGSQIKNLLVISDGREDTPETRSLSTAELDKFKQTREQEITQLSRKDDIRVFTVAIGDENGKGLSFVDRASLTNISKGANGGDGAYIELTETSGEIALQQDFLRSRLDQTLARLRESFGYSYSLSLRLDESQLRGASEHKLWVAFTVGDGPRVQLPVEYTYALTAAGTPVVTGMRKQPAIFIQSAPKTVNWIQLSLIYIALLSVFLVLAIVPATIRRLIGGGQALRLHKAITRVSSHSPLVGSVCPNEGTASGRLYLIKEGDIVLVCPNPDCKTPHHLSCWRFNEHHCMQRNCELEMVVPPKVLEKYGLMERELT